MSAVRQPGEGVSEHADVLGAVMRPFGKPSNRYWTAVALLTAVVVLGLVAWVYQLRQGMATAGYRDSSFWAIYIANVVTFIGVSYGGAVVSAILMLAGASWRAPLVRLAEGVALVTVVVGGAFIVPHLGRPDRLADMVIHGNVASPVFWDMVAILTYTFATLVFFLLPLVPDTASLLDAHPEELGRFRRSLFRFLSRGWVGSDHQRRVLHSAMTTVAILIIPLAVAVHSVLAWAFALVTRPGWHESIWAPYFVIAALYSGVALVIVVVAAFRRGYHLEAFIAERHFVRLAFIMVALGAVYVYLTFADLLPSAYVRQHEPTEIIYGMLEGRVAVWFWIFVIAGTILPLVLVGLRRTRTIPGIVTASALVVVAMWIKRLIMVNETASYNHLTNSFGVGFRFTWVSVSATLAGVAAVALLLMLLFRLVPLLSITEIQQLPHPTEEQETEQRPAKAPRRHSVGPVGAVLLIMMASGALGLARTQPAYAESGRAPSPTVSVTAVEDGVNNTLTATVTADGKPVEGALVSFAESTTMFAPGDNEVPLGSVETDESGTAVVTYVAAVTGSRTITATYFPTVMSDPVVGKAGLDVTQAADRYRAPLPNALSGVGHTLVLTLFGLVLLVLGLLTAQVVRVRRACRPATNGLPSQ